ncbi:MULTISPECIES: hypothetical protein [unclassified Corallococcus]|uniref:hypothetical protein n=1 Tax=unclassified Corallococcus TaxID=2685029 RepID=UPI001A904810|nr:MULTISPECIES: hypothetical protein [unclassified Corallococcus]MBN9686173.1 hypothetical protein [Corallococcus sp. NCSPR001]WAS82395.1 hypothetical protein O0N60_24055 [Corallococcus sp. NCRR]
MPRKQQEHGLSHADRVAEIERKFGRAQVEPVLQQLSRVSNPTEKLLGAIVFLAREGHVEDIALTVADANTNPSRILNAATVKDERG